MLLINSLSPRYVNTIVESEPQGLVVYDYWLAALSVQSPSTTQPGHANAIIGSVQVDDDR